jgi:protein-S-isoprenylcysteine O-methyltransferase Ste14
MEQTEKKNLRFINFLPVTLTWIAIIAQIILTFVLWDNYYDIDILVYIGYGFWGLGAVFGILPMIQFRLQGGVEKGDSYIKTTKLVTSGLYAVVRHPQYLASVIISIALAFMSQHWLVAILVLPPIIFTYIDTSQEDKVLIEKFGEEYERYKRQVPKMEPISGIIRLIIRKIFPKSSKDKNT